MVELRRACVLKSLLFILFILLILFILSKIFSLISGLEQKDWTG